MLVLCVTSYSEIMVSLDNLFNIARGFCVWRYAIVPLYSGRAGIVGGNHQHHIVIKSLHKFADVFHPTMDVFPGIVSVYDIEIPRVPGISCISPVAPEWETASGLKLDSTWIIASIRAGSTMYFLLALRICA